MLNVRFFSVNRALTPPQLSDDKSDGMEEAAIEINLENKIFSINKQIIAPYD